MNSKLKYSILGLLVFGALWFGTHPHIALALFGAPAYGILLCWLYDLIIPDYRQAGVIVEPTPKKQTNPTPSRKPQRSEGLALNHG